jgi:hypothetical protein
METNDILAGILLRILKSGHDEGFVEIRWHGVLVVDTSVQLTSEEVAILAILGVHINKEV